MNFQLSFANLPFKPDKSQVIYVESLYDEQANRFITDNYHDLRQWFEYRGYEFIYLPMLFKDDELKRKVLYYAPYLETKIVADKSLRSSYLLNFLSSSHLGEAVKPSILFGPERCGDEWLFQACELPLSGVASKDIIQLMDAVSSGTLFVNESCVTSDNILKNYQPSSEPRSSRSCECEEKRSALKRSFFSKMVDRIQGELFEDDVEEYAPLRDEVAEILENLENNVKKLRLQGVTLSAIHEFIDKQEPLSPLVITEDLRIFLPEYNNIEIELSAQRKALYFLFLNHPEGIVLQHLEEYHKELMNYYKQTNGGVVTPRMEESIKKLETYGNNQLNVVITRIREAFCSKFDERLARHYFISGERGQAYKIGLPQALIRWEE
jgi:hypothetical protein